MALVSGNAEQLGERLARSAVARMEFTDSAGQGEAATLKRYLGDLL
jgi:hypothetical protein